MPSSSSADVDPRPLGESDLCRAAVAESLVGAQRRELPFRHWLMRDVLPREVAAELDRLPFAAPDLGGVSGTREAHNATRTYFDAETLARFPVCRHVAECFQDDATVARIAAATGADLDGCYLRIEFAQDTGPFWLKPHTDLGVKRYTLLYYLSPDGSLDLGTDLYENADTWALRAPFEPGAALAFVPSDRTWHGFEPRPLPVVRKSVILNYVTDAWIAREQLAFPDRPVVQA
jgi:hypothetical protein